jgi:hypothetical protein
MAREGFVRGRLAMIHSKRVRTDFLLTVVSVSATWLAIVIEKQLH